MPSDLITSEQPTLMQVISDAVMSKEVSIEVVERLFALQRQMAKDQAESDFNDAMNRCQLKMKRINANMENPQTRSRYADYAQIDRAIRPIYTDEGFSLSFSDGERTGPDMVRLLCYVSRGGHTRMYHKDMPIVTVGPQGKAVMTPTHATGSADAYAKRYLVKDIFNLSIGEDDDDGNLGDVAPEVEQERNKLLKAMEEAKSPEELTSLYRAAVKDALKARDYKAIPLFDQMRDKRHDAILRGE